MNVYDVLPEQLASEIRYLASQYHGGMMTALYAMSSTGSLELYRGEGNGRLLRELSDAIAIAQSNNVEDLEILEAAYHHVSEANDEQL